MSTPALPRSLPSHPSFEQLRNQAADLQKQWNAGDPDARQRILLHHPQPKTNPSNPTPKLPLHQAQFVLAREYGYPSWTKLKRYVKQKELIHATSNGDLATVTRLLDAGVSIEGRDQWGNTPIGWVGGPNRLQVINLLLDRGANLNQPSYHDHSPVALRAYEGDAEAVQLLLSRGANPNQERELTGETALHLAMVKPHPTRLACVQHLLTAGGDPNRHCKPGVPSDRLRDAHTSGETPLHMAAQFSDPALIKLLLDHGADPTAKDQNGQTPADWAQKAGHPAIAALLSKGGEK